MNSPLPLPLPIAFPPIHRHGVIGDRRTGALVAADGTINWFCTPEFDGPPIFGALLDPERGGFCRFGPMKITLGKQKYLPNTALLVTAWADGDDHGTIEVTDVMAWPHDERADALRSQRVIIRRLRVTIDAPVSFELYPRRNFASAPEAVRVTAGGGATVAFADGSLGLWTSFPVTVEAGGAFAKVLCRVGYDYWAVVGWNESPQEWSVQRAASIFADAEEYWLDWSAGLKEENSSARAGAVRHSALVVQLLSHAHHDSPVAALTTSLPERVAGDRNYDYRYAWVRDASLSLAFLARMGRAGEVSAYLEWLSALVSDTSAPLQVCYRIDGNPRLKEEEIPGVRGYKDSRPVRVGNRAARQLQLGSAGFFADCVRIYIDEGGEWRKEFWDLLRRTADFTSTHWKEKDCGIWELSEKAHYVSSRVMAWVVLERAIDIAGQTGHAHETGAWREAAAAIHAEVMDKGWCEKTGAFRQRYDSEALDASALLIPLMRFLPIHHPRVSSTLAAIERALVVNGLVHRFDPAATFGSEQLPIGEFEGAFLPCIFWHAHVLAKADRCDEAEAILAKCEEIAGAVGIFAEEICVSRNIFLGNTPLLFSQVEYARAVMELNDARARLARQTNKEGNP
jgi:GH15 family glucan-1,4-alpha-glucosidase